MVPIALAQEPAGGALSTTGKWPASIPQMAGASGSPSLPNRVLEPRANVGLMAAVSGGRKQADSKKHRSVKLDQSRQLREALGGGFEDRSQPDRNSITFGG